jgi:hypothetical protein
MAIKPVYEKLDTFFEYVLEKYIENDLQPQLLLLTNTYVAYIMYILIYYIEQHY